MGEAVTLHGGWCREGSQEAGIWGMNGNRLQTGSGKRSRPRQQDKAQPQYIQKPHTGKEGTRNPEV